MSHRREGRGPKERWQEGRIATVKKKKKKGRSKVKVRIKEKLRRNRRLEKGQDN